METLTIQKTIMTSQTEPLIIASEDLKRGKKFIRNSHRMKYLIKFYYVVSTGNTLAVMDEQYARYLGYHSRREMLTASNQLANYDRELVHDAELDHIYLLQKVARDSHKYN